MKKFLILTFLLIPSLAFASQKVFYDSLSDLQIVDVSGQKTAEQIVEEFGLGSADYVQEVTIDEAQESVKINEDGNLVKHNFVAEAQKKAAADKENREYKETLIKNKLGLSDSDWLDLKEALGLLSTGSLE